MTARRLSGFDATILYFDVNRPSAAVEAEYRATYAPLAQLLARSDILSIHTPLTESTRGAIGADAIAQMKTSAIIVNTARGGVVDEAALYDALVAEKIAGAGLDSYETEPLSSDSPLLSLDQVVFTPHAGGGVFDNVEFVARHAFGNMEKILSEKALAPDDVILPQVARAGRTA